MISATEIGRELEQFFARDTEIAEVDGQVAVLTPSEYPDGDGVVVYVSEVSDHVIVSDWSGGDTELVGRIGRANVEELGRAVAQQLDVTFKDGAFYSRLEQGDIGESCWRVAQASARLAAAGNLVAKPRSKSAGEQGEIVSLLADALTGYGIAAKRGEQLEGVSGHRHKTSLYLPHREMVIEPIAGRNSWSRVSTVFTEFHDLRQVNGYRFMAVLDDRQSEPFEQANKLFAGLADVGTWSDRQEWLPTLR